MRRQSGFVLLLAAFLVTFQALPRQTAFAAGEDRLAIYAPSANLSLPILQYKGQDYVGLFEILEPFGAVQAKTSGTRWKLRFNKTEAEFNAGSTKVKISGKEVPLNGVFLLQNNRGLIPLSSVTTVLSRFIVWPIDFHEKSRRLFLADAGVRFTTDFGGNPPALVLNFSAPVNPSISTAGDELRMTFTREPLRSPPAEIMPFPSPAIPSASYREESGMAEITVHGATPLLARFSNNGQTITIAAAPVAVTQPPPTPARPAAAGPTLPAPPAPQMPAPRQYFAVVDAAHGGDDPGTVFSPELSEKSITLAFARRIRQELENRGIATLLTRDGDYAVSLDQRANLANGNHVAIYISVHASPQGRGLRLYRPLVPPVSQSRGPFLGWNTAQSGAVNASESAAQFISAEAGKQAIPVRVLLAPVRPMNNVVAAAIAVEVQPSGTDLAELNSRAYQQRIASIVAGGVAVARNQLGSHP